MKNCINSKDYDFIEIGTSDFDTLIETATDETLGISIEPIGYYINRLPDKANVIKVQAALSTEDGEVDVYYIDDWKIEENNLPWWVRGSNSINNPHPFSIKELGEELYNSLVTIEKVPTISWKTLIDTYGVESIGYLKIDTEGHDHVILRDFLDYCKEYSFPIPNKITLEYHDGVSNKVEIDKLVSELSGYQIIKHISDITLIKPQIPRIIHQTFKTNDLPNEISKVVQRLKGMNPTFEYRFYNNEDCIEFIKENYDEETLNLYLSINPTYGAARADFFRYLLMYKVGGVYLDIKSCTTIPLEETLLPTDEYLLTHWKGLDWASELNYQFGEFQNWHIICRPEHPFLGRVIEIVKENIKNYIGGADKGNVLKVTGPIAYSHGIIELLSKHKINKVDSPVREFLLENEIGLRYMQTSTHHHNLYEKSFSRVEPLIIKDKVEKAYVLYATENYFDIVKTCVKSIREYSDLPIFVYLMNSDLKIDIKDVVTLRWDLDIEEDDDSTMYLGQNGNFYINRSNRKIYRILIQRPLITKDVLTKYAKSVAYIDSDSIATKYVDTIFDRYNQAVDYPYFVKGIYDFLQVGDSRITEDASDLSTTLEHPSCELFNVNQYVRRGYRQTGYYVANQNCINFLDEWYSMCVNSEVLNNTPYYAPFNEETIANVLLWKYNIIDGLPYLYTNGGSDLVNEVYTNQSLIEERLWVKVPEKKEDLLFFHGEKRIPEMNKMIQMIKEYNNSKTRVLFLAPHLSTGGMPAFLLKRIQSLLEYGKDLDLYVVEFSNHSDHYVVQKNKIKELLPQSHFWTLGEDKMELIKIIEENKFDIIHLDEMIEAFDCHNPIPTELMNYLYKNDRTWRIVETCHNIVFNPSIEKHFHPEAYAYCSPWHKERTFKEMPSYGEVIEFPIEDKIPSSSEKTEARLRLGFDLDKKHVISVGLWTPGKNQKEGVELARLIEKSNPEYVFHFIGNQAPNFQEYWEPIMKELPSNAKVWGERSDTDLFFTAADAFMFNSTWECNPLVLREAISYGLPTISRNLPQYLDMFTDSILPIDNDINKIKETLLSVKEPSTTNYQASTDQVRAFAEKHINLYNKIMKEELNTQEPMDSELQVFQHFVNNPFLELKGTSDKIYKVEFFDENGVNAYTSEIGVNHWVKLNRSYFTKWRTRISYENQTIYEETLSLENKRVYISIDSRSLGDSVAWIPYMLEFKNAHNCKLIVSTFWNNLFEKEYPEIEFITPGTVVSNIYAMYRIGWFNNPDMEPVKPNTVRLQEAASNILGLEFKEIKPKINFTPGKRPFAKRYVAIANESTSGLKYWNNPTGWKELTRYLLQNGYEVVNVSKNGDPIDGVVQVSDNSIENTMNTIYHSDLFIGLSSGLSWLAWALGKKVVMISNFTKEDHEFVSDCIRITNPSVCNGCWNNPNFMFDKGDWYWCPIHKNTERQFECHKSITAKMVIDSISEIIEAP